MIRGTDLKLKFLELKQRLKMETYQVKGVLQSIWDLTAENANTGDIGRFTNAQIAAGIGWPIKEADALIEALVETRWLDESEQFRLHIHNWSRRCEDWVKKRVKRAGLEFADVLVANGGQRRTTADNGSHGEEKTENRRPPGPGPGPGAWSLEPVPGAKKKAQAFDPRRVSLPFESEAFKAAWDSWCSHRSEIRKPLKATSTGQQLKKLAEWGEARATEAIEHTIEKGWTGVREPDGAAAAGRDVKVGWGEPCKREDFKTGEVQI